MGIKRKMLEKQRQEALRLKIVEEQKAEAEKQKLIEEALEKAAKAKKAPAAPKKKAPAAPKAKAAQKKEPSLKISEKQYGNEKKSDAQSKVQKLQTGEMGNGRAHASKK